MLAKSDSLLVTRHVTGEYQAKDPQMAAYLQYVQILKETFAVFELIHVPREQNAPKARQFKQGGQTEDMLECMALNESGGELFKGGFRKLFNLK